MSAQSYQSGKKVSCCFSCAVHLHFFLFFFPSFALPWHMLLLLACMFLFLSHSYIKQYRLTQKPLNSVKIRLLAFSSFILTFFVTLKSVFQKKKAKKKKKKYKRPVIIYLLRGGGRAGGGFWGDNLSFRRTKGGISRNLEPKMWDH